MHSADPARVLAPAAIADSAAPVPAPGHCAACGIRVLPHPFFVHMVRVGRLSSPRLPVVEGGYIYGGGATIGGTSTLGDVAGGTTAEGAAAGGGASGGGIVGGGTAHAIMVLSIPRLRHMICRRETIGRTPCCV